MRGGECSPVTEGLVEGSDNANSTSYELQLKGEEEISQERSIFMAPGTSEKPSPQCATMAAVDNSRYIHYGIPGYSGYGGLPVTTSPPNPASLLVSIGQPSTTTSLLSQNPTLSHRDYVPRHDTPKSSINAPTHEGKINTGRQTETDKLTPTQLWKGTGS